MKKEIRRGVLKSKTRMNTYLGLFELSFEESSTLISTLSYKLVLGVGSRILEPPPNLVVADLNTLVDKGGTMP